MLDLGYGHTDRTWIFLLACASAAILGPLSVFLCKNRIRATSGRADAPSFHALLPAIVATILGVIATPRIGLFFIFLPASPLALIGFNTIPLFVAARSFTVTDSSQAQLKECGWVSLFGALGNAALLFLFAKASGHFN